MDLLRNYPAGYNVLPTANPHDVVNVSLQLALYHLVDMVRPTTARGTVSSSFQIRGLLGNYKTNVICMKISI